MKQRRRSFPKSAEPTTIEGQKRRGGARGKEGNLAWDRSHWKATFVAAPPGFWPSNKAYVGPMSRTTLCAMRGDAAAALGTYRVG